MAIQAVIFDLDDTLFLERDFVHSGYRAVAAHLRAQLGRAERFEDWLWMRFLSGQSQRAFNAMSEHFSLGLSESQMTELVQVYREHKPDIRACQDIPPLLSLLGEQYRLGLLSDGTMPTQRNKLQAIECERFFEAIVFTEEIGRHAWKPSADGFELIARKLGVAGECCAYVGDNVIKDFIAPNRLSWRSIRYERPGQVYADISPAVDAAPQITVHTPQELREALR